jgi:antirestriction protein ArdC
MIELRKNNMDIQLQMERIQNARRAMVRAQNPKFRKLWDDIANKLFAELEDYGQPWLRTYDGKLN